MVVEGTLSQAHRRLAKGRPAARWAALALSLPVTLNTLAVLTTHSQEERPNLRLSWVVDGHTSREAPPVRGDQGDVVELSYELSNQGPGVAIASRIEAWTALGPAAPPRQVRPAPAPRKATRLTLSMALEVGMRELCLEARVLGDEEGSGRDRDPVDNRLCRRIQVRHPSG